MSCGCDSGPCNPVVLTADQEPLASAVQNFIDEFFGALTKTVVDGRVVWTLPCDLATGLPGNPREPGEGLACYFKRLFEDGITGLKGDKGDKGDAGSNGANAFGSVSVNFTTPTLGSPNVTITADGIGWLSGGSTIYIATGGYFLVGAVSAPNAQLTLLELAGTAGGSVLAGSRISQAGPRGRAGAVGYVSTTAAFTPPAINGSVAVTVSSTDILAARLFVFVEGSGYYEILSTGTGSAVLKYKQAVGAPISPVPINSRVIPSGPVA